MSSYELNSTAKANEALAAIGGTGFGTTGIQLLKQLVVAAGVYRSNQFVGPLDAFTAGLAGTWSVARRLLTSYEGALIRVRRSNDNTEQDIGFTSAGELDAAALASFVGSNSAFVRTVYHQNGGSNLVQTTATNQPRIVNLGTVDTISGVPAMLFDGSNDYLTCAAQNLDQFAYYAAVRTSTVGAASHLFCQPAGATWSGDFARLFLRAEGTTQWRIWLQSGAFTSIGGTPANNTSYLAEVHNGANRRFVINGTDYGVSTAPSVTASSEGFLVGISHLNNVGTGEHWTGHVGELLSWGAGYDATARAARRAVVNDYWNLYT